MNTQFLTGASFALLSSLVVAQPDPNIGSLITFPASNNPAAVVQATLGFNFTFPGNVQPAGSMPNVIYIDSEGRISNDPALQSDRFESTFDFINGRSNGSGNSPLICAYWNNITPDTVSNPNAGVYFFTDANVARITWLDFTTQFPSTGGTYTAQIELRADGSILLRYDDRVDVFKMEGGFTGTSDASGGVATQDDLSSGTEDPAAAGDAFVWQNWLSGFSDPTRFIDFADGDIIITPTSPGIYTFTSTVREFTLAQSSTTGPVCDGVDTLTFAPVAPGVYNQTASTGGVFETNFGVNLNLMTDGQVNVPLMFPFTMPGGVVVNSIEVRADGHIIEGGSLETFSFNESVTDFENKLTAQIAPCWDGMSPENAVNGGVFANSTANVCTISWVNVPESFNQGSNTFQCQLFADGTIVFNYSDIDVLNGQTDAIIGVSPGSGLATGPEVDIGAGGHVGSLIYERFAGLNAFPVDDLIDLGFFAKDELTVTAPAVIGQPLAVGVSMINPRLLDLVLFGFPSASPIDLTTAGIPCDYLLGLVFVSTGVPAGVPVGFTLPNDPNLIGLQLFVQAALVDVGGIELTNGLNISIGDVGC